MNEDKNRDYRNIALEKDNLENDLQNWDKKKVKDLAKLHTDIARVSEGSLQKIEDKTLKKRVAEMCLQIINDTPQDVDLVLKRIPIIAEFVEYDFNDKLDTIFAQAVQLIPPEDTSSQNVLSTWNSMKALLEDYLADNNF